MKRTLGGTVPGCDLLLQGSQSGGDWGTFTYYDEFTTTGSH